MPNTYADQFRAVGGAKFDLSKCPTEVDIFSGKSSARAAIKDNAKAIQPLDGTTAAILHRTPPLNVKVASFKAPTKKELAHDYLWRVHNVCPGKGEITVFNRSHYEDVLVVKVRNFASAETVEQRYEQINNFEKHLTENGTTILKFMLHISHETQGERLRERLEEPRKRWKFNPGDLEDRKLWSDFMNAYETMVQRTSTAHAPWHIIPSDSRSTRGAIVSGIVKDKLEAMKPEYPDPGYRPEDFKIV